MKILQFRENQKNYVGMLGDQGLVKYIAKPISMYQLALKAIEQRTTFKEYIISNYKNFNEIFLKDIIRNNLLMIPMLPDDLTHCFVSGVGLTHLNSVLLRDSMSNGTSELTDAHKIYLDGLNNGKPSEGKAGARPEWFYKGNGHSLRKTGDVIYLNNSAQHPGEEAELVAIYIIGKNKTPYRVGFCLGNEFSDHGLENENSFYLAQSKLFPTIIGSEVYIGSLPPTLNGKIKIFDKDSNEVWSEDFETGYQKMTHSLENIEMYYFSNEINLNENDVHFLFLGADKISFTDKIDVSCGCKINISSNLFELPLINEVRILNEENNLNVKSLF